MKNAQPRFGFESAGALRRLGLAGAIVAVAAPAACRESLTQVDSGVVAPALRPALKIARPLPGLADIVEAGRPSQEEEATLLARWRDSWDHGAATGGILREEIYLAAGSLAVTADSAAARSAAVAVREALAEARSFGRSLPPHLTRALAEAERLLNEAGRAISAGDWNAAVFGAVRAADALRETSPGAVALALVEAAEDVLGPAPGEGGGEPVDRVRARRLAWWARLAINAGGHELAIQRGYYACLLLGVELP